MDHETGHNSTTEERTQRETS